MGGRGSKTLRKRKLQTSNKKQSKYFKHLISTLGNIEEYFWEVKECTLQKRDS